MTSEEEAVVWGSSTHHKMSGDWSRLPLVPLRIILQHLTPDDALRATAVCRHWRTALLHYHGHRETLKLRVGDDLERNVLVARIFRKNARRVRVLLDGSPRQADQFLNYVMPLFFDALKLHEVFFLGPVMSECDEVKIQRILVESLIFKQLRSLQNLALVGCTLDAPKTDRYSNNRIEYYPRPLSLSHELSQADAVLQHIAVDYDQISTQSLKTLSQLRQFSRLTLLVCGEKQPALKPVDWLALKQCYPNGLHVAVIGIDLTEDQIEEVMQNVLLDDLNLVSLKMLFNKILYCPILYHVADKYKSSLREVVWADAPHPAHENIVDLNHLYYDQGYRELMACDMNPFIIMCWQCRNLRRIVIHGYWTWQYDIVGFFRMRPSLEGVEVSGVRGGAAPRHAARAARVRLGDRPPRVTKKLIAKINEYAGFKWAPIAWDALHPALKANSTDQDRADYIIEETSNFIAVQ